MTWFRVDDGFPQHPKVLAIPRRDRIAAVGLWTLAGGWCSAQLTDGHLAAYMVEELGSSTDCADVLVRVGLWETTDDGYRFHDWSDWNPTRAQVMAERQATRDRVAKFRERKRNAVTPPLVTALQEPGNAVTPPLVTRYNGVSNGPPVPSRPDPQEQPPQPPAEAGGEDRALMLVQDPPTKRRRGTRIPEDWRPSQRARELMIKRYPDFDWHTAETVEQFRDYWIGRGDVRVDWDAAWRTRMADFAEGRLRPVNRPARSAYHPDVPAWERM